MAVDQFSIWNRNKARPKAKGPARSPGIAAALAGRGTATGPEALDSRRDAWANALSNMSAVNTPDPITAAAKIAAMGLAGWGQGRATKERDEGSAAYQQRLADALAGKPGSSDLMSLYADPYATPGDKAVAMRLWERNNPTPDELLQRQLQQQQLKSGEQQLQLGGLTLQQQQDEIKRQNAIRNGQQDQVEGWMQDFRAQGGDLFEPGMQAQLRAQGIQGVDPADAQRFKQVEPYAGAGDYGQAFNAMVAPPNAQEGFTLGPGEQRFNAAGGVIASGPPKVDDPGNDERWFAAINQDRKVKGLPPMSPEEFVQFKKANPQVSITNDMKGQTAFDQEAGKIQAGRYGDIVKDGDRAVEMLGNVNALRDIGAMFATGKGAEAMAALGPYAEQFGVSVEGLAPAQAYQAVISRIAPSLRTPGVGSSSDFDARQFLMSLPALGNLPEGNAIIQDTLEAVAQWKIEAANISQAVLQKRITPEQGDAAIRGLGDPWSRWKQVKAQVIPKADQNAPRIRKWNPETGALE